MRPYFEEIISQYEKFHKNKHGVDFDISFKVDLGKFLNWLDKNRVQVWID